MMEIQINDSLVETVQLDDARRLWEAYFAIKQRIEVLRLENESLQQALMEAEVRSSQLVTDEAYKQLVLRKTKDALLLLNNEREEEANRLKTEAARRRTEQLAAAAELDIEIDTFRITIEVLLDQLDEAIGDVEQDASASELGAETEPAAVEAESGEDETEPAVVEAESGEDETEPAAVVEAESGEDEAEPAAVVEAESGEDETEPVAVVEAESSEDETEPAVVEAESGVAETEPAAVEAEFGEDETEPEVSATEEAHSADTMETEAEAEVRIAATAVETAHDPRADFWDNLDKYLYGGDSEAKKETAAVAEETAAPDPAHSSAVDAGISKSAQGASAAYGTADAGPAAQDPASSSAQLTQEASFIKKQYIVGNRAGQDLLDSRGKLIIRKYEVITEPILAIAEADGKLADLIVHMILPGFEDDET
ncbi:hypothetical protein [Paenibacillus sp. YYML68]|uniref:hypothetical protein n=1 Tax=Paenibacillus sp. YYML68 TaxID=2909250 RepID=UPI00249341B8|nr:hypothetical protein [Paenibacillus sp. YYML68]